MPTGSRCITSRATPPTVRPRAHRSTDAAVLEYGDIEALERTIDSAYSAATQRLFENFFGKFRLLDHMRALRDYLLLGRGDFFELLIESLGCAAQVCDHADGAATTSAARRTRSRGTT